jgi:glycosyltransferase involved in cell wall biosynthesis
MVTPDTSLPHITFVIHNIEGGVASMNHQIIENADFRRYFHVHILLWRTAENTTKEFHGRFTTASDIRHFSFSKHDNYYRTLHRLHTLLEQWPGLVVTNDGMELEAIRKFGTGSALFSIVHDFYNLKLAIESLDLVDHFLCHTEVFTKALLSSYSLKGRVGYLLHGVKVMPGENKQPDDRPLKLVSISRLMESKGVLQLSSIDDQLLARGIRTEWIIIGSGELSDRLQKQWKDKPHVRFYSPAEHDEVLRLATTGDVFVSPSTFEGYGIALLEAMSCGLVPVIHRLPVGVYSQLPDAVGFSVDMDHPGDFVDHIARLDGDRELLARMSVNARRLISEHYNISKTAINFLNYFASHTAPLTKKQPGDNRKAGAGILDKAFVPSPLSRWIRKMKSS